MGDTLGLQCRFSVMIGGFDLGQWSECRGLEVSFEAKPMDAGGFYDQPIFFPERIKYSDIELVRAMSPIPSLELNAWLQASAAEWQLSPEFCVGVPAVITLFDAKYEPVMVWTLPQAFPKQWKGPQMSGEGKGVATETLVLTHSGFLA